METSIEALKAKYKNAAAAVPAAAVPIPSSTEAKPDRGIKGTFLDDYAIEIAMKLLTLLAILVVGSIGYLWLERIVSAPFLTPWRIWLPVVGWIALAFIKKPFLKFGWWGSLCTIIIIPTVSGYLWQMFSALVGKR